MHFDERIREWCRALDAVFDIRWSSSWEEDLLWEGVCDPLGLPHWPSVNPVAFHGSGRVGAKAAAIHSYLDRDPRPFAWVDDHLHSTGRRG